MEKKGIFLLLALFVLFTSNAFAFSNSDFSVSDEDWKVEQKKDCIVFLLKEDLPKDSYDYDTEESEENEQSYPSRVIVSVVKERKTFYPDYTKKELDDLTNAVKEGVYKQYFTSIEDQLWKNYHKSKSYSSFSNDKNKKQGKSSDEKALDDFRAGSGMRSSLFANFGDYKAFQVNFDIGNLKISRYVIYAYKKAYLLDFIREKSRDMSSIIPFGFFEKSFKIKAMSASKFNYLIFEIMPKILILMLIVGVRIFVKKIKG